MRNWIILCWRWWVTFQSAKAGLQELQPSLMFSSSWNWRCRLQGMLYSCQALFSQDQKHLGYKNINNSKVSPLSWSLETGRVSWGVSLKIYLILTCFPWNVIFAFPCTRRLSLVNFHLDFCYSCIQVESTTKPILIQDMELWINSTVTHVNWYLFLCYY